MVDSSQSDFVDYYEVLQISPNADPETVHRVYRLLAQRFHPDHKHTSDAGRFRAVTEAYAVLKSPERRAAYDVVHDEHRKDRWRLAAHSEETENDFSSEQTLRLTVLEMLYTQRRIEPGKPGIFQLDFEKMTGQPREHLEFTIWYLVQKKLVQRTDNSMLVISADGVEYLETHHQNVAQLRRLRASND
jgi:curved DNA-binding protein CbpA